jgi:predicted permease
MEQVLRTLLPFMLGGMILSQIGQRVEPISDRGVRAAARMLTKWVIWVAMPSLVLTKIHGLPSFTLTQPEVFLPVSQPWLHFTLVFLLVGWLGRRYQWNPATVGALMLTIGLGNTSFVGIPLLNAILGPDSVPTGILLDQLGSFLILTTTGITLAHAFRAEARGGARARRRKRDWVLNPLKFPPFAALLRSSAPPYANS